MCAVVKSLHCSVKCVNLLMELLILPDFISYFRLYLKSPPSSHQEGNGLCLPHDPEV